MTRKTFKRFTTALALTAVLASTSTPAYFAVSLPGNALTMSGVQRLPAPQAQIAPASKPLPASGVSADEQTRKPRQNATRAWLRLPTR